MIRSSSLWLVAAVVLVPGLSVAQAPASDGPADPAPASAGEPAGATEADASPTPGGTTGPSTPAASPANVPPTEPPAGAPAALAAPTGTTPPPTSTGAPTASAPTVTFTAEPGRGLTARAGDTFSVTLLGRIQLRNTLAIADDDADADRDLEVADEIQIRTLRLWLRGFVLDPDIRYGIQLALGGNDFETLRTVNHAAMATGTAPSPTSAADSASTVTNPSPIFDAYLDVTELRDLSVRIGQFFVPFDRARTIREFALQSVDRAEVIRELTLDRDVGISLYSNDLFGLGWLSYNLSLFGGDGRNRFGARDPGFLYVARVAVRPFGSFDDDMEGDVSRSPQPRLMIGAAFAFNHMTDRRRSTTGDPYDTFNNNTVSLDGGPSGPLSAVTFDQLHVAADLVFKWGGFYFLGEFVYRQATTPSHTVSFTRDVGMPPVPTMLSTTLYARDAWGYVAQASMMLGSMFEVWGRWDHLSTIGPTDPAFVSAVAATGHAVSGGVNCYLNGHYFKIQLDWAHSFGDDFGRGPHVVRLQLDATF